MQVSHISPSPDRGCVVYRLSCRDNRDRDMIHQLRTVAAEQKANFVKIFPWEVDCTAGVYHYVSLTFRQPPPAHLKNLAEVPTVCGWMTVMVERKSRAIYIKQIATRHATDASYRKVGLKLYQALEHDIKTWSSFRSVPVHFVYLFPLDDAAAQAYLRWGFLAIDERLPHMVKPVRGLPTPQFVEDVIAARERDAKTDEKHAFQEIMRTIRPRDQKYVSRRLAEDPALVYALVSIYDPSLSEEKLNALVQEVLRSGGAVPKNKTKRA